MAARKIRAASGDYMDSMEWAVVREAMQADCGTSNTNSYIIIHIVQDIYV